ncbi:uncharacterized protein LY89DRAFT_738166 [Mollisia scopiformis]|uniref:Ferric reductase NAD binding domain-containing protein n=1 Tax=Mollisia scopiformis TaxID=149040 RepID=A0A194WWN0_MOLSC|nr:uncharacterized protein LY89DRAFT_738166 [Mollisia scopiformis]KUJ12378.1 hypothetical protein LY89DRAFT_738166 [Mollisia scopiformis]
MSFCGRKSPIYVSLVPFLSNGTSFTNTKANEHDMSIINIRGRERDFDLDRNGFTYVSYASQERPPDTIKGPDDPYVKEMAAFLENHLGARSVTVYDGSTRKISSPEFLQASTYAHIGILVTMIELFVVWNNVVGVHYLGSAGQLIPFITGVAGFVRVESLYTDLHGSVPNLRGVDRVVFIAGGSGGSFTAGFAVDLLRNLGDDSDTTIEFIWVIRHAEMLTWYESQLAELSSSPRVKLYRHVTHHPSTSKSSIDGGSQSPPEKAPVPLANEMVNNFPTSPTSFYDLEKILPSAQDLPSSYERYSLLPGRPNVSGLIGSYLVNAQKSERLAVVACGPSALMLDMRKTVADNISVEGPALELHGESFGW